MVYSKEDIIAEIRRISTLLGQNSLKIKEFKQHSKINIRQIASKFGGWSQAISEAGLEPTNIGKVAKQRLTIDDRALLEDLIRLYKENGKVTENLISAKGKFSIKSYTRRWKNIKTALLEAQKMFNSEFPNNKSESINEKNPKNEIKIIPQTIKPSNLNNKRKQIFGEPINFRGLTYAPINEQGVVYLFGMVSHELGYLIESVRIAFPDCEGKRRFDKATNQWEHIKIEFEYKSSNFLEHGHNPEECDIIVCWIHDWQESPIEVLELKSVIKYL